MVSAIGHVKDGAVLLAETVDWSDGQEVLVIVLPSRPVAGEAPPQELLDEDEQEFAPRRETLDGVNRRELA